MEYEQGSRSYHLNTAPQHDVYTDFQLTSLIPQNRNTTFWSKVLIAAGIAYKSNGRLLTYAVSHLPMSVDLEGNIQ